MTGQNKDRKLTLGLKSKTLGLNSGSSSDKMGLSNRAPSAGNRTSKGKVVVVTKSRGNKRVIIEPNVQPAQSGGSFLTESEKEKRILAIQTAEKFRRQKSLSEEQASGSNNELNQASEEDLPNESESNLEENQELSQVVEDKQIRSLHDVLGNGNKIKNLDEMYRSAKNEPETIEPESFITDSDFSSKTKKTFPKEAKFKEEVVVNKKADDRRMGRKMSVAEVMMMDEDGGSAGSIRRRSLASIKRAREKAKRKYEFNHESKLAEKVFREVKVPDFLTVQELANRMAEKSSDVIKSLMKLGIMATVNQAIDADTAELVVHEFGHKISRVTEHEIESTLLQQSEDSPETMQPRPPVVTIMGHVDHGKTSLLDALRQTDVAAGEAGGITQHIGAYQIKLASGKNITFLDTPGHEAFTAMRMRGASVTDVVVLVVAADDGIMPQTVEAISHAKAAKVPIIVAVNKIDKPEADPVKIRQALLGEDLIPEEMGGDIMVIDVSAKQKLNLDKLEDSILLQAEMLELKANPNRFAEGVIVESKVDKGRGPVATLLVQRGTLKVGDMIVAGCATGKIRALINDKGASVDEALPSSPIEILGLDQAPVAGDDFIILKDDKSAKELVEFRKARERQRKIVATKKLTLEQMFTKAKAEGAKELPVIIKADVQGSVEAICSSLEKLGTEEIGVRILHSAVGGITESDITLAGASNAIVIGFNVRASSQARDLSKTMGVDIRYYSIIYKLVDEIKAAMGGMLSPTVTEDITGYAQVREIFNVPKLGKVAGCYVTEGVVKKNSLARLIRNEVVIYDGKLKALKRFKDDVKEVNTGFECGISFENYDDIKKDDRIESYELTEKSRTL